MTEPKRVCVVGPGTRFLSGITYYTYSLIDALSRSGHRTSAVLIRNLCPPGCIQDAQGWERRSPIFVCRTMSP